MCRVNPDCPECGGFTNKEDTYLYKCEDSECDGEVNEEPDWDSMKGGVDYE